MSARRLVDTNVVLRFLVQDHDRHSATATRLFRACDRGELTLVFLPAVLAECVFVLESFYRHPRMEIARVLGVLLSSPGVEIDDREEHLDALRRYGNAKSHFVDCTIAAFAVSRVLSVATFDADFKKFRDVTVEVE
jgi:predicted nucleic-acid-binding protein